MNNTPLYFNLVSNYNPKNIFISKLLSEKSMELKNSDGNMLLSYILSTNMDLFEELVNMKTITENKLKEIMIGTDTLNERILTFLLSKELNVLFNEENMIRYISICIANRSKNLKILTSSKYYKNDSMKKMDSKSISLLIKTYSGIKYIFDNGMLTQELAAVDNYLIFNNINNPFHLEELLKNIQKELLVKIKFNNNSTILHKLSLYPKIISQFVKEHRNDIKTLLLVQNNDGNTFLHNLVEAGLSVDLEEIIKIYNSNSDNNTIYELLTKQNMNGDSVLMLCCDKMDSFIFNFFENEINKKNYLKYRVLTMTNNKGISFIAKLVKQQNFAHIIEYCMKQIVSNSPEENKKIFDTLLEPFKSEYIISDWEINDIYKSDSLEKDIYARDIMEVATLSNRENLEVLLKYNNIVSQYNGFTRCFILACKYQPHNIIPLYKTKKVDINNCYDTIKIKDENGVENYIANYLQLACRYNPNSVRELINSDIDLKDALNEQNKDNKNRPFNAFILATTFEPSAMKMLIDSKYITKDYIVDTNTLLNRNCMFFALNTQLSSLSHMHKSPKFVEFQNDAKEGNVKEKLKTIAAGYWEHNPVSFDDPLFRNKDTICSSIDQEACGVCVANKQSVIFNPCAHKSCISCAIKIKKCHVCRAEITNKLFFR